MKNILFLIVISSFISSCTKDLGYIQMMSSKKFDLNSQFEIAQKRQTFEGSSLEDCVSKALSSVPNSSFLRNTTVTSKGKKVTIVSDVWSLSKKKKNKRPSIANGKPDRRRPNKNIPVNSEFKVGMKVAWSHPKAGEGSGIISKIIGNQAEISLPKNGDTNSPVRLPLSILKIMK